MPRRRAGGAFTLVFVVVLIIISLFASGAASAQEDVCNGASVIIEGGDPSPFVIPAQADSTLRVEPDSVLSIRAEDTGELPATREVRLTIIGFGFDLDDITRSLSTAPGSEPVLVDVGEELPSVARGLFEIEGTLIDDGEETCTVGFDVRVGGFGGAVATAATATSAVVGAGALASAPLASNGMNAKLKLKVQLRRRRPRGLARFLPIPAWKRTLFSTFIGAITGLALAVVLQQAGVTPMSIAAAIWGAVAGGGITFGVGYSLGAIRTYFKPPEIPQEKPADTG